MSAFYIHVPNSLHFFFCVRPDKLFARHVLEACELYNTRINFVVYFFVVFLGNCIYKLLCILKTIFKFRIDDYPNLTLSLFRIS